MYVWCHSKISFIVSFILTLIGCIFIMLLEADVISPYFIDSLGSPPSPYEPGSHKDREYHLKKVIPYFTFLAKLGVHLTFAIAYYSSYCDPKVFPLLKRSMAVSICNFVARAATIFAPLIAELDNPWPLLIIVFITIVAFITALTFPSRDEARSVEGA